MLKRFFTTLGVTALGLVLLAPDAFASPAVVVITPPPPPPATKPPPSASCRPATRCKPYRRYRTYRRYRRHRTYRRYRTHRRYRSYRRYRPHRRYRRHRRYRLSRPYHKRGGPYFGYGMGYGGFIRPEGAYRHFDSLVYLTPYFGWSFNPIFALELGYSATLLKEKEHLLGDVKGPGLFNVTLDLKVRFLQPSRRRYVVPYLQAGLGVSFLQGTVKARTECEDDKGLLMAHGGSVQVGGGLDIYLSRWLVLGARALYRPMFMSGLRWAYISGAVIAAIAAVTSLAAVNRQSDG